jgi:hypothetical protein
MQNIKDYYLVIEKIIDKDKINGLVHYLIKWKGYDASHNTWQSRKQLIEDGVKHIIDEYEKSK